MLWLLLGAFALFVFLGGLRAFERASVTSIKSLVVWILALGGGTLALLLILTGREGIALGALTLFGPLIWQYVRGAVAAPRQQFQARPEQAPPPPPRRGSGMTVEEAYQVLGLAPGASEAEIKAAHLRLMRKAHPDQGGSDWLATRINQARDVLLGRGTAGRS